MSDQDHKPSPSGGNGRGSNGQFLPGNRIAKGNPFAVKVGKLRSTLLGAVTLADLRQVVKKLVDAAKGGDVAAAKVLFDRLLGPPTPLDFIERLESLEAKLANRSERRF